MLEGQFTPGQFPQFEQIAPNFLRRRRMLQVLQQLGLTTNLKLCLDASDGASLPASATKWLDTAGAGYDFFLGTTAGVDATDPTINGTANGRTLNEFLSFDGGDYLTYDTTNETWMNNIHKDNAKWTVCGWMQYAASGSAGFVGDNGNNNANIGFSCGMSSTGKLFATILNASGAPSVQNVSVTSIPTGSWCFLASTWDEAVGANGHTLMINSTQESFTSTYVSPSVANASVTMQIGARGNAQVPMPNGSKMASLAMWEGTALTPANLTSIFNATRGKFGV